MIRLATLVDLLDLVYLAERMHAESRYRDQVFLDAKVAALVSGCIRSDRGLALVGVLEDEVVGGFLGGIDERAWNRDLVAFDYGLFVTQDRRGGILAMRMLEHYVEWARALGATPSLGATTGVSPERCAQLFARAGFEQVGTLFEAAP